MTWTSGPLRSPRPSSTKPGPTIDSFTLSLFTARSVRLLVLPRLAHLASCFRPIGDGFHPPRGFRCSRPKKYESVVCLEPTPLTLRTTPLIKQEPFKLQKSANCLLGPPAFGQKPFGDFFFRTEWKSRRKKGTCHPPGWNLWNSRPNQGRVSSAHNSRKARKECPKKKARGGREGGATPASRSHHWNGDVVRAALRDPSATERTRGGRAAEEVERRSST